MDGWGLGDGSKSDAIANAKTPFVNSLYKKYPHSKLKTSGEDVGLPEGQMGNSEVGHLNIGAGRVVYQDLETINKAIKDKTIDSNPALLAAFSYAKKNNKQIHLMGLLSDGGVHSSQEHLHKLVEMCKDNGLSNVFIHAFMDGRDTDPKNGIKYLEKLQKHLLQISLPFGEGQGGVIASVIGRYYAMDRDKRWERIKIAYDLLVNGIGKKTTNVLQAIQQSYNENSTDEFIKPIVNTDVSGNPVGIIKEGDVVICFNFRTDRCREITEVLTQKNMPDLEMKTIPLYFVTMTNYDNSFKKISVVFEKDNLEMTIGEVLSKAGKTQIRIAETEKYPHVSFFFSGGRETVFDGENRIMVPSPKVATYDLQPEMSASEVADRLTLTLSKGEGNSQHDFVCLNFANADMVGHTGVYDAIIKAVETTDKCVERVVNAGIANDYSFIIIADHGNADCAINPDGTANTAHTTNPVPCILIDKDFKKIKDGRLADIAPTILKIMGVKIPKEMTGEVLIG